jgi:molybdate transport system ATP-binding protein
VKEIRLIAHIRKQLSHFSLQVQLEVSSEILVLFGPSGAGKTTILDTIAGLITPDWGEISLDGTSFLCRRSGKRLVNLPARKRGVGYVFQHYALFPHLTALQNAGYALRRQVSGRQRAMALLDRMSIAHLADRYPHELSGGQQQRVAIARALATSPKLLLLDEPFSALDMAVRERLQRDLRALQSEFNLVVIYVTHRLEDAFAVGHRLAVIRTGCVEQVGPIEAVFRRPANPHVADIMGIRNLLHATVVSSSPESLTLDWDGLWLEAPPQAIPVGSTVTAYIRPEEIKILYPDRPIMSAVHHNRFKGKILDSAMSSSFRTLRVLLPNRHEVDLHFPVATYSPLLLDPGVAVELSLRKEGLVVIQHADG